MIRGTVSFLNRERGYGFITRDDGERDMFFHYSGLVDWRSGLNGLEFGDVVEFEIGESRKDGKPKAVNLRKI